MLKGMSLLNLDLRTKYIEENIENLCVFTCVIDYKRINDFKRHTYHVYILIQLLNRYVENNYLIFKFDFAVIS